MTSGAVIPVLLAALALASPAAANQIKVNTPFDEVDPNDGSCSLREAVTAANSNFASGVVAGECAAGASSGIDVIVLPAGPYVLQRTGAGENTNATGDLDLTSDIDIIGAGARTTTIDANHIDRVFDVPGPAPVTVVLAGITIQGGRGVTPSTPGDPGATGGAIRNRETLTVAASTLRDNGAGTGAGGTSGPGGGTGGAGGAGGAIVNEGSGILTVRGSTLTANFAGNGADGGNATDPSGGGGAGGSGGSGGAISSGGGTLTLTNDTLTGNFAGTGGKGGAEGGNLGFPGRGGVGGSGGGISITAGSASLTNVTLASNDVGSAGQNAGGGSPPPDGTGGGFKTAAGGSLTNTVAATNVPTNCAATGPAISDGGHNISFSDTSCPGANADPRLGALQNNGGQTDTLALGGGSAAVDLVPAGGACPAADQRAVLRPAGPACDAGAYEQRPATARLSATTLPFGRLRIGLTSAPRTITLTNVGDLALSPTAATLGGTNPADFAKAGDTCTGAFLALGASCSIGVRFKPIAAGLLTAALRIADNAPGSPQQVALRGTGIPKFAGVAITGGDVHLKKGKVRIGLSCPRKTAGACAGTLTLKSAKAVSTGKHGSPHVLTLGSARFTISPGKVSNVTVKISQAGRKLVHHNGHLAAIATAVTHDGFGTRKITSARLKLLPG